MGRESLEKFFKLLSENKECQAKVKSLGGDIDALSAYAREQGYDVSPDELREYQEKSLKLLKGRMQKKLVQPDVTLTPGAQALYEFIKLARTDESVAGRMAELDAGAPEELIAFGREKGFIFNEQDMQAIGKNILEPSDELNDEELELVAGGTTLVLLGFLAVGLVAAGGLAAGAVVGGGAAAMVVAFTSAMK